MITRDQIINDVIKAYPDTIGVFNEFKVDSCCGGGRAIAETAAADGLTDLTPLLHALNRASRNLEEKGLGQVVSEIESTHHAYLRRELPELQTEVDRLATEAADDEASKHALELQRALSALSTEITEHLFKEEQILFPTIRRMEEAIAAQEPVSPAVVGCGARGPVSQMNFEHEQAKRGLDRIRAALQGLEAAPGADGQAAALKPRFTRLRDDMLEHIRAEEEDLFPRAVELEGRVMELLQKALGED
jgi:regulator of cell morphogenesis and NO signaling